MANDAQGAFLASLLGGGSSGADVGDLTAFANNVGQNSIWNAAAAPILGARFNNKDWSPAESGITTALQAFAGTLLQDLGQRDQANQLATVAKVLPSLYDNPEAVGVPEGVDPAAFGALKLQTMARERQNSSKLKEVAKFEVMKDLFSNNPALAAKALGIEQEAPKTALELTESVPSVDNPLASGGMSTNAKFKAYYKDLLSNGVPATQAATAARSQVEGEIKANTGSFDEAKQAREYGSKLMDLANTAKAGISAAGQTGPYNNAAHTFEYIRSLFPGGEEANRQLTGDAMLASIAPELMKMSKSPGAVSDLETKQLLGSGPNTLQTPEANAALAQKIEDVGKLNVDYADYLEAYREANAGSTVGAGKKWSEYKKAHPIFVKEGDEMKLNSNRPSWQEFFANAGSGGSGEDVSVAGPGAMESLPQVGGTFQGEKIKAVRRVR